MDRAGRHRRLAIAIPPFSLALLAMAVANLISGEGSPAYWVPHVLLAASLGWALTSMLQTGRLVCDDGRPHPGVQAVGAGLVGWVVVGLGSPAPVCCPLPVVTVGVGIMVGGILLFTGAERGARLPAVPGGRSLLSIGALLLGIVALNGVAVELSDGRSHNPGHAAGLGLLGIACLLLAIFEGRLAIRMIGHEMTRNKR